ncbi:hypothetical protein GTG28_13470 [Vibrio sp. OCN044]|uniref:META domain-containing protein n=1 Tax=Vibrio tetraodonis subsp. pristinus TaxID=2695891 RepID=A0A6L8LVW4_9VIBR|nr:hypothetical protein [Vibrio tetraodonis]MYM60238.1 hypothetical protein [Vibrio tetraodonis subsp. pristinus]
MKITPLSMVIALSFSSGAALAQSPSFAESMEGRIWTNGEVVDGQYRETMRLVFADKANPQSIRFTLDHTCGSLSGTMNVAENFDFVSGDLSMVIDRHNDRIAGSCSDTEIANLNTFKKADNASTLRTLRPNLHLQSKETGGEVRLQDNTNSLKSAEAQRSVYDSYWIHEDGKNVKVSAEPYLKRIQQSSLDDVDFYGFQPLVAHEHGLRITRSSKTHSGLVAETKAHGQNPITWAPFFTAESPQTRFEFTNVFQHGYTQGTIDFGFFDWAARIHLQWPVTLMQMATFEYDNEAGKLTFLPKASENTDSVVSDDTDSIEAFDDLGLFDEPEVSQEPLTFTRLVKEATITDLKDTEWTGNIAGEHVTANFKYYSLNDIYMRVNNSGEIGIVKLTKTNDETIGKARVLYAPANQEASALLRTTLPELKSVVMEYSGDTRKLHMVTASDIVTLTEDKQFPIVFPQ